MSNLNWRPGKRVAIAGAGPGGISTALAFLKEGYDVRVYESKPVTTPIGGAVLLSIPVMMILRHYGVNLEKFTAGATMWFTNAKGKVRAKLPASEEAERASGIRSFSHGVLRSTVCDRMIKLLPEGVIQVNRRVSGYQEHANGISVTLDGHEPVEADILIGADGIRSRVANQAFGDSGLFHLGIKVWLAHCEAPADLKISRDIAILSHSAKYQASHFPLIHEGKEGFEWWIVERFPEGTEHPKDPRAYVRNIVKDFDTPVKRLVEVTNFETSTFQWEIYNRPPLTEWSKGRVVCLGDAVHPVSPYAGYGLGMAIEDGYFIARSLRGVDLRDAQAVAQGFKSFEAIRVKYTNGHVAFAQKLGRTFHGMKLPLAKLRDLFFDNTPFLGKALTKGYLEDALKETMDLKELHVTPSEQASGERKTAGVRQSAQA